MLLGNVAMFYNFVAEFTSKGMDIKSREDFLN